jgi:hypothetical protein
MPALTTNSLSSLPITSPKASVSEYGSASFSDCFLAIFFIGGSFWFHP